MKKISIFVLSFIIIYCSSFFAFAHSGGTDSKGGHYNRSTGGYHYHHGYPAHSHPDGVCPYEVSDEQKSSEAGQRTKKEVTSDEFLILAALYCAISYAILAIISFICFRKVFKNNIFDCKWNMKTCVFCVIVGVTYEFINAYVEASAAYLLILLLISLYLFTLYFPIRKSKFNKYRDMSRTSIFQDVTKSNQLITFDITGNPVPEFSEMGLFGEYTCYKSDSGLMIHYKHGCSSATNPKHCLSDSGLECKRCIEHKPNLKITKQEYDNFKEFMEIINYWNISTTY